MTEFHLTITGQRFYNGQLPALIAALQAGSSKQSACNMIAAGILCGAEGQNRLPHVVAEQAIATYKFIEEGLKCS